MGVLLVIAIFGLGRSFGGRRAGLLAAAVTLSVSDVIYQFSLAAADLGASLLMLLAFAAVIEGCEQRRVGWIVLAGVLSGLYAGAKLSNAGLVIALGLALGAFLLVRRQGWRPALGSFLGFGAIALLVAGPWYLRSWWYTGNPVYPYAYGLFGGRGFSAEAAKYDFSLAYFKTVGPRTIGKFIVLPLTLTFRPQQVRSGYVGPLFLSLLPLLILPLRRRVVADRLLLGLIWSALSLPIWYWTYPRIRTLFPVLAVLALCIGWSLAWFFSHERKPAVLRWVIVGAVALWMATGLSINIRTHASAVMAAVGLKDKDAYADAALRGTGFVWYGDYQQINAVLPPGSRVLIWDQRGYYLEHPYDWAEGLYRGLATPVELSDADALLNRLRGMGITHIAFHAPERRGGKERAFYVLLDNVGALQPIYESPGMMLTEVIYGH